MSKKYKVFLLAGSAAAVSALTFGLPAHAQDIDPATNADVSNQMDGPPSAINPNDVIIVTAQKRETSLQDTALAISAFSGAALERQSIDDVISLQSYVPTLHVGQEQDSFKVSIRGIGTYNTGSISDPGVALYTDGFYIPRPSGGNANFFDVNRIEVLKGPQGTLYGRNATGGVVNIISNAPVFETEGQVGFTYGNRDHFEGRAMLNMPLSENLALRVTGQYKEKDGYVENVFPGDNNLHGSDGDINARGQLLYRGKDDLEVLFSATHSDLNGTGVGLKFLERNNGGPPPVSGFLNSMPPDFEDPLTVSHDENNFNDTTTTITFARVTKDFGGIELFVQAGKLWQETSLLQDVDSSPLPISNFGRSSDNDANSLEVRLASTTDAPLQWIVGGYYFEEETFIKRTVDLNGLEAGVVVPREGLDIEEFGESETYAGFGNITYSVNEKLNLTGGIRYTSDTRGGSQETFENFGRPGPAAAGSVDFDRVTWKAGVEYRPKNDVLMFGSISNGYKAGGFNLSTTGEPYSPELVTAYEAGLRTSPLGGRAQFNLDGYYYDYTDLQLTNLKLDEATGRVNRLTANAAATTIQGIEVNGQFELAP